ncbi:class II fumarate hydratase [Colwellia sp. RE-S-Sl-9]
MMPKNKLWGDQTKLSLQFFKIGHHQFSTEFINKLISIKRACAQVNYDEGLLKSDYFNGIIAACDELLSKDHAEQFPLSVWQTGSGTQTNMNVNEVICTLANTFIHKNRIKNNPTEQASSPIHPNDHVNMSQSSNDVFPTAMHLVVAQLTQNQLLNSLNHLHDMLYAKETAFKSVLSVGRTHLMDALPLPASAVFSGYCKQLTQAKLAITESLRGVYQLAIGGTAVGNGDNAPANFGDKVSLKLAEYHQLPFQSNDNKYAAVSGEDALVRYTSALKQLASVLFKIANDFRLLASGPRCGFNEWLLPANEPGSSIMPGKVNPTQCEALSMVCLQVFGNELTVSLAASHGQLQLNTYRPVIIYNVMESIELLSDAMISFANNCVSGLELNQSQIDINMEQNLSVITLLTPKLGYDISSKIVHKAHHNNISLGEAAESLSLYTADEFDVLLKQELINKHKL